MIRCIAVRACKSFKRKIVALALDSRGYQTPMHQKRTKSSAQCDDVVNLIVSRPVKRSKVTPDAKLPDESRRNLAGRISILEPLST